MTNRHDTPTITKQVTLTEDQWTALLEYLGHPWLLEGSLRHQLATAILNAETVQP